MRALRILGLAALATLAACAHKPVSLSCDPRKVQRYALGVPVPPSDGYGNSAAPGFEPGAPPPGVGAVARERPTVASFYRDSLRRGAVAGEPQSLLMMSGGGERGAFGAGLLAGWQAGAGALPKFAVVTGVSTGALLGTFAFIGRADIAVQGYTIDSEADLVNPLGGKSPLGLVRKGAAADLVPLRARLQRLLSDDVMTAVATESADDKRRLLVGVVDVDDGEAYAYSLGEIARHWVAAPPAEKPGLKACYVEAIIASASAPPAAPPVFINDRELIDGGARFGMFFVAADEALRSSAAVAGTAAQSYLIVNGTLELHPRPVASPHADWDILNLGLRSVDVLQNQVYRFSADYARRRTAEGELTFRFARIEDDAPGFMTAIQSVPGETETLSCQAWQDRDTDGKHGAVPLQFQKRYMRCLIEYGRARASKLAGIWYQARP